MKSNVDMVIIDRDGEWFVNRALFPMPDPDGNVFQPMMPTKIKSNDWIKAQEGVIVPCPDPAAGEEMPEQVKPVENTIVPKDEDTKEPVLSAASGVREPVKAQARK